MEPKIADLTGKMPKSGKTRVVIGLIIVAALLLLFFQPFAIVGPGNRGVVVQLGAVQSEVLGEGFHFRVPVFQQIKMVDCRIQKAETDAAAASKDLQQVTSKIVVNYRVEPDMVAKLYQRVGTSYEPTIISPATQESIKAVTAKYTAEELITKRSSVSTEIKELLSLKVKDYGIIIDNFNVVDFNFSQEFNKAIESKQTAEQLALKAKRDLDRIKIEAEQKVTQAKAEAEALRVQKQEVTQELVRLREIEAQIKAIDKWDGHLPNVTGGTVPFIQIDPEKNKAANQ